MLQRTFFRIMSEMFLNNAIFKSIASLVNFCKELQYYNGRELKFSQKMPINNVVKEEYYKRKFVLNSITGNRSGTR